MRPVVQPVGAVHLVLVEQVEDALESAIRNLDIRVAELDLVLPKYGVEIPEEMHLRFERLAPGESRTIAPGGTLSQSTRRMTSKVR